MMMPGDEQQMDVAVRVGGGEHRVVVVAQPAGGGVGELVEVRPPQRHGDQQADAHCRDACDGQRPRAGADRDDRLAEADQHELPVALGEVRDGDLLEPAQPLARQPSRACIVDRQRPRPEAGAGSVVHEGADEQQHHADCHGDREPDDRTPRRVASAGGIGVQREVQEPHDRVGADEQRRVVDPERARERQPA